MLENGIHLRHSRQVNKLFNCHDLSSQLVRIFTLIERKDVTEVAPSLSLVGI